MDWKIEAKVLSGIRGTTPTLVIGEMDISVPHKFLKTFGFISHGPELGVLPYNEPGYAGSEKEQNDAVIAILYGNLLSSALDPKIYQTRKWLNQYPGRMVLGVVKPMSKKQTEAIKLVSDLLKEESQNFYKHVKETAELRIK
jgi:hypothetical protein